MLTLTEVGNPRIDINMCGTDAYIQPIDKVHIMDEDSFEQFTLEWLYGCKKANYCSIKRIGGAVDKGRDIIAYCNNGLVDYYQCKHYKNALAPSDYYLELGKLCYYTYKKEIPIPQKYYIIASNDVGSSLQDLIDNPSKLTKQLIDNWDTYCKSKITKAEDVLLNDSFLCYVKSFDFTIINTYSIASIVDEHLDTIYGSIRFGGRTPQPPALLNPSTEIEKDEMTYVIALLAAYSDELGISIDDTDSLQQYSNKFYSHFCRQRKDYYSAETINRFVRDTLTDSQQFGVLKEEIYNGIIDTHEQNFESGYKRLVAVLQQATTVNTSKCLLDSKLKYIGSSERKGVCHMLVNDNRLQWVNND